MRRPHLSPSFVVAVLALVLAAGGTGYAAGKITTGQIKDDTVQSRDIRNGTIQGKDVRNRSLPRTATSTGCARGEAMLGGGCVRRQPYARSSHAAAVDSCRRRGGRLPSVAELRFIANSDEFTWADGNGSNYEFSGEYTDTYPVTPIGLDRAGYVVPNSSAQLFWHHCITS